MKVIIIENILIGGEHTEKGSVPDLEKDEAKGLINIGRAVEANKENLEKYADLIAAAEAKALEAAGE